MVDDEPGPAGPRMTSEMMTVRALKEIRSGLAALHASRRAWLARLRELHAVEPKDQVTWRAIGQAAGELQRQIPRLGVLRHEERAALVLLLRLTRDQNGEKIP